MTPTQFDTVLTERIQKIHDILANKAAEYGSADRLHNFKVAARLNNESPLQAAWGMATKHLVCLVDMVKGDSEITPYMVEEKFGDMINYLILMEAICLEEMEQMEPMEPMEQMKQMKPFLPQYPPEQKGLRRSREDVRATQEAAAVRVDSWDTIPEDGDVDG